MPNPIEQSASAPQNLAVAAVPITHWGIESFTDTAAAHPAKPLVEPMETFTPRLHDVAQIQIPLPSGVLNLPPVQFAHVSNRQFQTDFKVSQGSRGTCWAFAGCGALEAAYARTGVHVKLSEQYAFHISKAHENHVNNGGVNSLIGFQGSSDIVHHLKHWAVPVYTNAPYIDQPALQALANSIPNTNGKLANAASGSREQNDWFEFDLRNIPLMGRWFAQYRVKDFVKKTNFTNDDIKAAISNGYDVVVDAFDKINNGGHVLLIFGYNDLTQTFDIKNSQSLPGFSTMKYANDAQFNIQYNSMFYITAVEPVATQCGAMWVGRWETDHDGWRGTLVIRRFLDIRSDVLLPAPDSRISLGTWYAEDGRVLDVVGHFVDGGRGLHCNIGDQPFELYLHTRDPYRASGRCFWNNQDFGVVLSRGTAVGAGSGFNRNESIGLWDMVHDGWRGTLQIGADPTYVQAADSLVRRTWIDPGAVTNRIDAHIDFGGDNRNQHFELLLHTREDCLIGGVTSWSGKDWHVEARMSQNLYAIYPDASLHWYRNTGRARLAGDWDPVKTVGSGWGGFHAIFGGGDGVIYAIRPTGEVMWYYHDGRNQGTFEWQGPKQVGTGWAGFTHVFAGEGGVIYGVDTAGKLQWYRHLGRRDGAFRWQGPFEVGSGWNGAFTAMAAAPDGCIYGIRQDGSLMWYRHYGHDQGYPIWTGPNKVGTGWQNYNQIWAVGNGYIYGRAANGDLYLWRHHGFLTGEASWTNGVKVGNGWSNLQVFAT